MEMVYLSALLRPDARSPEGQAGLANAAAAAGMSVASTRAATVTLTIALDAFATLFGREPERTPARRGPGDTHVPPGFAPQELPVPDALGPWLEAIGVEAAAVRLARGVYH